MGERLLTLSRDSWSASLIHALSDTYPTSDGLWLGEGPMLFGPPTVKFDERSHYLTAGSTMTATAHQAKDIVLPVKAITGTTGELEAIGADMARGVDPIYSTTPVRITYQRDDATNTTRWIDAHLIAGGNTLLESCGSTVQTWRLGFRAPHPYWSDGAARTVTTVNGDLGGLTTAWSAAVAWSEPTELWSAAAAEVETSTITGDMPASPTWELDGPFTQAAVLNDTTGEWWLFEASVLSGETLTVETSPAGASVSIDGVVAWGGLRDGSTLFDFAVGAASYTVAFTGNGTGTEARMGWLPAWLTC